MIFDRSNSRDILLYFIVFAILFLGGRGIGILSIRNACAIFLIYVLIRNANAVKVDFCQKTYIIYLFVLLISNIMSGQIIDYEFIRNFLSGHIVCVVLFLALPILFNSYFKLKNLILFLSIIYGINCIVSILQFTNNQLGWEIGLAITPDAKNAVDQASLYKNEFDNLLSRSLVFGIVGFVVANGYFTATFLPLVTSDLICKKLSFKQNVMSLVLLILSSISIFMIQQRMAFAILLVYIALIFILKTSTVGKVIIGLFIILFIGLFSNHLSLNFDMGRLVVDGIADDSRMNQFANFLNFFNTDNFIWGAELSDARLGDSMGHNTLMDSLRRGGFFSFLTYIFVFVSLLIKCVQTALTAYKYQMKYMLASSISCLLFLIYSFTHSTGVQSGAIFFWILYSMMLLAEQYEKEKNPLFD